MANFDELFGRLSTTRLHYEQLRDGKGSLDERARLGAELHTLRAEMARARKAI